MYTSGLGGGSTASYNYVFNYTDHLGNIRVRYAMNPDPNNQELTILEEDHYYPFGLTHEGYNDDHEVFDLFDSSTIVLTPVTPLLGDSYKYGFQGQELSEDLGLNWHEWKYRMSDPALGRFWQIDPLAEDYTYNSPYALQENKMGMGVELEGLELGDRQMDYSPLRNTINDFSTNPNRKSTGKPIATFGLGYSKGKSKSVGSPILGADTKANALNVNAELQVGSTNGDAVEFNLELATLEGNTEILGERTGMKGGLFDGNLRIDENGNLTSEASFLDISNISSSATENEEFSTQDVIPVPAYVKVNPSETGRNLSDIGLLVKTYIKYKIIEFFGSSEENVPLPFRN